MSLDVNKSLIENSDYLKRLSKELSNKSVNELDSNLIYEVSYASTYLDIIISKSRGTNQDLIDIKLVFDNILSQVPYEKVSEAKSKLDYKKLLKCKYDNLEDASYFEKKSYTTHNVIATYIYESVFRCAMYLIFILIISGVSKYAGVMLKDASHVDEVFNTVLKVALIVISGLADLAFIFNLFSCMIDLLWFSIPAFRLIMKSMNATKNLISPRAASALEKCMGEEVYYKEVRNYDRIERNKIWLSSMLKVCTDDEFKDLKEELIKVSKVVSSLESNGLENKEYYLSMAKIEFLHDKYLQICNRVEKSD